MFIFLSYNINENTPIYGGKEGFISNVKDSIKNGNTANTSYWKLPNHTGTHIDFPYHFYENGQKPEEFSADFWIIKGDKIQILDIKKEKKGFLINTEDINYKDFNENAEIVLLKTDQWKYRNEKKYWEYNYGLSEEIAKWIRKKFKKIKLIGLDSISVSSWQHREIGRKVHRMLLNPGDPILLVEDMDLSKINLDTVFINITISPILVNGTDGSPCTIIAEVK